jgi:glucokinase
MISISLDVEVLRASKYTCQVDFFEPILGRLKRVLQMVSISLGGGSLAVQPADRLLAYDIGGSHVTAGLCLLEPLTVVKMAIAPLPAAISSDAFIGLLQELGQQLSGGVHGAAGASIAFPGPFVYNTGISHMRHKLGALYGVDLRTALADRFGWTLEQVRFLNDADAALLGEAGAGAAQGAAKAVGIMLGTGIGFAFVQNGALNGTGRMVPPDSEIWNLPFIDGIVEDVLSSRALERDYEARTAKHRSVAAIAQEVATDPDAGAVFETFGCYLGQVIREILAPLAPEVIVFGGGISRSSHLFLPAARNQVNGLGIRLVPSVLLEKAPLLGAAMYWRACAARESASRSALMDAK